MCYHWFAYGESKKTSMKALAVYLLVSAVAIAIMALVVINIS
jgi:hypothetical protein